MEVDDLMPTPEDLDFRGVTSRYADMEGVTIEAGNVPESLRHLIPLAKHWSVGDDSERADLMWLTPYEELKALVLAVLPFREEIQNWCSREETEVSAVDEVNVYYMLLRAAAEAETLHVDMDE